MGHITTHVLDTAQGRPAADIPITLHFIEHGDRRMIASTRTNADGRTASPLVAGDAMSAGRYELTFSMGDYWRAAGVPLPARPFLDDIVIRVGIDDTSDHYHVPLLVSPYGYSTYRGS